MGIFDDHQIIEASTKNGNGVYKHRLNTVNWQDHKVFKQVNGCLHIISTREKSECSNVATVSVRMVSYPRFFTSNNDGTNDHWNLKCLEDQPKAAVIIFDRFKNF